ncbi:MAG: filamentous hemagglutinin N-terminal domain-containing protein, partial [Alphaproteobacteria bacterium]|nr:filamentous hemagglutinin N-terminal domain-containing protein [Alphaproteobacteria bacterium]
MRKLSSYTLQNRKRMPSSVSGWGKAARVVTAASFVMASSPALATDLIADPSASLSFRPSITSSSTGVPVINITNPTAGGVSLNRFSHFNVGSEGVIHNNSLNSGNAGLGGSVAANPNLSVTASTIVDEVTSSNASTLAGTLEVFGGSANLIIVNPNGITCSGCGVINIPRFTMTTGSANINIDGTDIDFDVNSGLITINGEGLNGNDFSQIDLIARELLIQGPIYRTSRLDLIAGANDYDYEDGLANDPNDAITEDSSAAATGSTYQIDASSLSEMSAGKINIIGTDDGVGVRIQGNVGTTTGDVVIDADGNLLLEGSTTSEIDTVLRTGSSGRTIDVSGGINGGRDIIFDATGDVSINALVAANRRVTVDGNGQDFTNNGQDITGSQMNIQNVATFTNDDGDIEAGVNDLIYEVSATDSSLNALAASIANQININPGFEGVSANATTDGSGVINIVLDDIAASAVITATTPVTGSDEQTFTWASTGANTATLTIAGTIEANDSYKLSNAGDIVIGSSSNPITTLTNTDSSAVISAIGGISIYTSGDINNQSGANITADRAIVLNSSGGIVNQDSTITGTADVTLEGDTLTLSTDAAKFTRAGGVLTLDWNQAGFDFDYSGEQVKGNTGLTFNVPDEFTNSADLSMPGDIRITAASVTANRDIIAGDDLVITTTGDVTNNDVIFANDDTAGGDGLVIDAGGSITNANSKSIYGLGDVVLVSDTFILNGDGSFIEAGGDLTLATVTGETISDGAITGGTASASSYIFNTEGQITSGGDMSIMTETFNNWRGYTLQSNTYVPDDINEVSASQSGSVDQVRMTADFANATSDTNDPAEAGD